MEWQQASGSTPLVPIDIHSEGYFLSDEKQNLQGESLIYDQWGRIFEYLPTPLNTIEEVSERGRPWIKVPCQEYNRLNENFIPIATGREASPIKIYSKYYWTYLAADTSLSPSVYTSDYWTFFVGTRDGKIRLLKPYNLQRKSEDFEFPEEIIDISTDLNPHYMLVLTHTKMWQVFLPLREVLEVEPVDDYLRMFKTNLGLFAVTRTGNIYELILMDRKIIAKLLFNIASHVENLVAVENIGNDAYSGVVFAISYSNKVAILRIIREGNEFFVRHIFQFRAYTKGSVKMETSDFQLFIYPMEGWSDRIESLATLRAYSWKNLIQKKPAYDEYFLPGYEVVSMVHKSRHLAVTLRNTTVVIFDTVTARRLYVITIPEQPVMAKFESNHLTYASDDIFRVSKLPKTNKICCNCLEIFDCSIINSHNSVTTVFVCKDFF